MLKRVQPFAISVLSLAITSVAHAAAPAPMINNNLMLSIPNKAGFEFNIAALALKPGASNLNYAINNKELPTQSPSWFEQELRPAYTPAFEVGLSYAFQNSGQDVHLDWTHLSSNTSSAFMANGSSYFLGPDYEIGPAGLPIRNASGNVKFNYDVVNLDAGQFIGFGQHMQMRFFGGLSTGFLRENVTAIFSGTRTGTFAGPFSMTQNIISNFSGLGPRFGLDANYQTDTGFGFLGEASMSALIGSSYAKTHFVGSGQELYVTYAQGINDQTISDQTVTQVIPGFDAKLGINYTHAFYRDTILTVAAGYQAAVYINAISQYLPQTLVSGQPLESGGIFVQTMSHKLSNYSVQGPFLNFAIQFV